MPSDSFTSPIKAGPGYAAGQLLKALGAVDTHQDAAIRERAVAKAEKWQAVLQGMCSGAFAVGSRHPVEGVPVWATPEVVTGGFVTGNLLAGGPMREHELAILQGLGLAAESGRAAIHSFFLSSQGMTVLAEWLVNGRYEITVPEEGALLVVTWLMQQEKPEAAAAVLKEISPFFDRLRFYPVPSEASRSSSTEVSVQTTGEAVAALNGMAEQHRYAVQREMITVWTPMMDRLVDLLLETVEGEPPDLARDPDGQPLPVDASARFPVIGGWPCARHPAGWAARVSALLGDYARIRQEHRRCAKPDRKDDNFCQLRELLAAALPEVSRISWRDLGRIRLILARYLAKHGQPGSVQRLQLREQQARAVAGPLHADLAKVVARRLAPLAQDVGLTDTTSLLAPITTDEFSATVQNTPLPESITWKVIRAQRDSIENLVSKGVLTSGESLALVLPKVTAEIHASGITDDALRRVQADVYRAFRKRRSLLLLNLESQVRIEELPWVKAQDTHSVAATALKDIATMALSSFPYAILPNRLVRELSSLSKQAGLHLPLVEEIASDIFMGEFGPKFLRAAKAAGTELQRTLYQVYFSADFAEVGRMKIPEPRETSTFWNWLGARPKPALDSFSELCRKRAETGPEQTYHVAANGMVIEQQQILTTQNLSVLMKALNLPVQRTPAAQRCWQWILRRLAKRSDNYHARLIMVKNAAYAWRQMIYFLSGLAIATQQEFLGWMRLMLMKEPAHLQEALRPMIAGLQRAVNGQSPEAPPDARLFLGWTTGKHWLIEPLATSFPRDAP